MIVVIISLIFILIGLVLFRKPTHNRVWELGQEKLARIEIKNSRAKIINFRNFDWMGNNLANINYSQEIFDLEKISGMDLAISHFSKFEGMAHVFIVFRFEDNNNIVISVESRREKGEHYSPLLGLFREFEIIYVVGSERDIVGLRTDIRKEKVKLYPVSLKKEEAKRLLLLIAKDINNIYTNPAFYNTFLNNCANVITRKIEHILNIKIPFGWGTFLPGYIDKVFYKLKLIPADKPFEEIKNYYQIDSSKVNRYSPNYLNQIRKK